MLSLFQILMLILDIIWFFIIAHVIMSWLINFQVLNLRQQLVAQIWHMLNRLLEPAYSQIRRFIPDFGYRPCAADRPGRRLRASDRSDEQHRGVFN